MKKVFIALAGFYVCGIANAGSATGKVDSIYVADDSVAVLFTLSTPINGTPRCNEGARFSINIKKPGGMAAYTAILEAKSRGYAVTVEGLNTCANEWRSEDIKNVLLH